MGMDRAGVTFASLMALGPDLAVSTARQAQDLGYTSFWTAETTGPEAFSILAAAGAAAPGLDLGTGVVALQLRTPMLVAMAVHLHDCQRFDLADARPHDVAGPQDQPAGRPGRPKLPG